MKTFPLLQPLRRCNYALLQHDARSSPIAFHPRNPALHNRTLFDGLLSSTLGLPPLRRISHTQVLPYSPDLLFRAVSSIDDYPKFLPFLQSSTITERDSRGYATRAQLKVGYDKLGLEEVWDSIVNCDPRTGTVEARGAGESSTTDGSAPDASDSVFKILRTKWVIKPADEAASGSGPAPNGSRADLDLHVQFRNPMYDQIFAGVEDRVASAIASAFEKRVLVLYKEGTKG